VTDQETKDQVAAGVFAGLMALALGGAGLLIAAIAVGVERAWTGRTHRTGGGWREAIADHEAWLAMDRERRRQWREQRRQWWIDGADPATRPVEPPAGVRFGRGARRAWAQVAVATDRVAGAAGRFRRGFVEGWRAANQVRQELDAQPAPADTDAQLTGPEPRTGVGRWARRAWAGVRRSWRRVRVIAGARPAEADQTPTPNETGQPTTGTGAATPTGQPTGPSTPDHAARPQQQEDPMTAPTTNQTGPQQGETNLDLTTQDLADLRQQLAGVNEQADTLAARRQQLLLTIDRVSERAAATGAPAATTQALDAARQVANEIGQHVGNLSQSAVEAEDVTAAAHAGLAPARDAQDALHAAGASGEFVSAATAD
jgi:hypothetical protein